MTRRGDRPRALDLFCGAGGASMGLHRAGFDVVGIDHRAQPRYPFEFRLGDALEADVRGFDLVWASPPCQAFTAYRRRGNVRQAPNLIPPTRDMLRASGAAYVIENVVGAPLEAPTMLCGSMFGLGVRRHRLFETNFWPGLLPSCRHVGVQIPVYGHGVPQWFREKWGRVYRIDIETQRVAMGIDWMTRDELSQAIPPAYSEWLGRQALRATERAA